MNLEVAINLPCAQYLWMETRFCQDAPGLQKSLLVKYLKHGRAAASSQDGTAQGSTLLVKSRCITALVLDCMAAGKSRLVSSRGWHTLLREFQVSQVTQQICLLDLASSHVTEGPAVLMGPKIAKEFGSQLSPDGTAVLVQKDPATFMVLQLPSLKVSFRTIFCIIPQPHCVFRIMVECRYRF